MKTPIKFSKNKVNSTQHQILVFALLTLQFMGTIACSKGGGGFNASTPNSSSVESENNAPSVDLNNTDGRRGSAFAAGATADLVGTDLGTLTAYVGNQHPLNNPTDLKVSIKLAEVSAGANKFAGNVYISYYDNGKYFTGSFSAGTGQNPSSGNHYPQALHASYNNWITYNNQNGFHGFFQDNQGAIMVVIESIADQNDGGGGTEGSGSIWFRNFGVSQIATKPNLESTPCWFITAGPYDCRTLLVPGGFESDGKIDSSSALTPDQSKYWTTPKSHPYHEEDPRRGWRKLGNFSKLNLKKAFSQ